MCEIKECKRCGSNNIVKVNNSEQYNPDTDESEFVSGFICNDCGCFHSKDGTFFQYDVVERKVVVNFIKQANDRE